MENDEQELRRKCEFQQKTNVHILKLRNGTLIEYTCAPLQRAQKFVLLSGWPVGRMSRSGAVLW